MSPEDIGDIVIEAFACELPVPFIDAMARRSRAPVWINLEYLSAETWVEDCHAMASRHPTLALTKYFFFPGFSSRTGGLPAEHGLVQQRDAFQSSDIARTSFLARFNLNPAPGTRLVSLFCYPDAPVETLLSFFEQSPQTICLVPEGVARPAVERFLGAPAQAGAHARRGGCQVQVLPFVDQQDYDKLLWSCDFNFVRGEDSFVRAQWAARPFAWHIYPQDDGAHWTKLDAFLGRYTDGMSSESRAALTGFWHAWNGREGLAGAWRAFNAAEDEMTMHARKWAEAIANNGDLASNLIQFARQFG
jgi:uncharacterized repeat protein (TIGR03837 family)